MTWTSKGKRASGILLHITSLPSAFGIGDMGPESYRFADLLARLRQHYWSILPLNPTRLEDGNSPYQTCSAFAGNPLLISPQELIENELLPKEYENKVTKSASKVNYSAVYKQKDALLQQAYLNFKKSNRRNLGSRFNFEDFCSANEKWLNAYSLYTALRKTAGTPWYSWPSSLRKREPQAIARRQQALKEEVEREKFVQYVFFSQWHKLKEFCQARRVSIFGDMPFYVTYDSADVWVYRELFGLNANGKPRFVGGVPPDYFSLSGQLWGNPVYNWKKMQETGFEWWIDRISHNLKLYDKLRLDHFRGFVAYWQVPASAKTAKTGRWVKTPSDAFFETLKTAFPSLPFIAEDLGYIDNDVKEAIERIGVPGMRVLLFAFDGDKGNPNLPKNHAKNCVIYTGTHDTNTVRGWFSAESTPKERRNLFKAIGKTVSQKDISFEIVKLALASVADLSIVPIQDVLGLGAEARMNNPSKPMGNWQWRVTENQLESPESGSLKALTEQYKR